MVGWYCIIACQSVDGLLYYRLALWLSLCSYIGGSGRCSQLDLPLSTHDIETLPPKASSNISFLGHLSSTILGLQQYVALSISYVLDHACSLRRFINDNYTHRAGVVCMTIWILTPLSQQCSIFINICMSCKNTCLVVLSVMFYHQSHAIYVHRTNHKTLSLDLYAWCDIVNV